MNCTPYLYQQVMSQVGIDLMHMGKANKGYNFVISCVDYFSKYCELGTLEKQRSCNCWEMDLQQHILQVSNTINSMT